MKRSTRNPAKAKQEIIEKSAPIFNVHGYSGTKIQMLVEATGYQAGGIYRHFTGKKDLAKAAFQYNYDLLVRQNLQTDPSLNPHEKVMIIFKNYRRNVFRPEIAGGCPILNTATEMDDTDESFRQLTHSFMNEVTGIFKSIFEEGQQTGHFRSDIDPEKEAQFIFALIEGAILMSNISKDGTLLGSLFDKAVHYYERDILMPRSKR
ncbi:MAG: TetR/AcrR family transcriptional regulator [Bacteroidota bacterium]